MKQYKYINQAKHTSANAWIRAGMITVMLFAGIRLSAQENVVNGIVRDAASQQPLFGVRVEVAGQPASAISNSDGSFSIKVSSFSDVLIVSAPDYATREIPLQGKQLSLDIKLYSILFHSGYGTIESHSGQGRKTMSTLSENAVTDFSASTSFSIEPEIQARLGGDVRTIQRTGVAGMGASMFIRGYNSLNASAQPLIVIDGVVWDNQLEGVSIHTGYFSNPLANIDSRDIESVRVLKDGNSLYGSKAANGVIVINTVRAKEMATKITANLWWGVNMRPDLPKMMNAGQYKTYASNQVQGYLKAFDLTGLSETSLLSIFPFLNDSPNKDYYAYHNNTHWVDETFQDGWLQNYSLGLSGGDEVALYTISIGYASNDGTLKRTDLERLNARFNSDIRLSSRLFTQVDIAMGKTLRNLRDDGVNPVSSPAFTALVKSPLVSPYRFYAEGERSDQLSDYDRIDPMNPLSNPLSLMNVATGSSSRVSFTMRVNPYFQFNRYLQLGSIFGYRQHRVKESFFIPSAGVAPQQISQILTSFANEVRDLAQRQNSIFSDTYLKGNVDLNPDNHLNLLGEFRYMTDAYEWTLPSGFDTGNDNIKVLNDGLGFKRIIGDNRKWKSMSVYANVDYDFQQKYILSLTATADASSRFGLKTEGGIGFGGVRWAIFPSVGGAWIISSENFMSRLPAINLLKLRASFGMTGNDGIDERANRSYFQSTYYTEGAVGLELANIQNNAIQWETSKKAGLGLDIHFLDERVALSADLFNSRTDNLLTQKALKSITGLGYYWSNGGALKNSGYELNLNVKMLDTRLLKWELGGSAGHYKNEITALPSGDYFTEVLGGTILTAVGRPAGLFYGYKTQGVFATTEEAEQSGLYKLNDNGTLSPYGAGDVHFVDPNGNGIITNTTGGSVVKPNGQTVNLKDSRQIIGDPNPDLYGTLSNRFKVKKWTLDALFSYSYGNDVYNYLRSQLESGANFYNQTLAMTNRWTTEGQVTNMPRAVYGDPMANNDFSDRWIEDGSYFRLKTLTIAYEIPLNSTYIHGIKIWASANNLFTWTKYLGSDPEFSMNNSVLFQGIDAGLMPQSRSYFLGVKIDL